MGALHPNVLWYGMDGEEGIYCPNKADACLISAAPDLLRWLERATEYFDSRYYQPDWYNLAKEAINKAKGL